MSTVWSWLSPEVPPPSDYTLLTQSARGVVIASVENSSVQRRKHVYVGHDTGLTGVGSIGRNPRQDVVDVDFDPPTRGPD